MTAHDKQPIQHKNQHINSRSIIYKLQQAANVPVGIWAVSMAVFLSAAATTMAFSISPQFITKVLGLSIVSLGVIEGLAEGISQIMKLVSGYICDRSRKRKPMFMLGLVLAALSKPFFILANGISFVMISKIIERISNGFMATPRDTYIASAAPKGQVGKCFGIMMGFKTVGCSVGSFIIGLLIFTVQDYRTLLWIGFVPCIIAIMITWFYMQERDESYDTTNNHNANKEAGAVKFSWNDLYNLPLSYWLVLLLATTFMLARFSDGFIILRLGALGGSPSLCASTIGIFNIVSACCCLPVGYLSDKLGRVTLMYFVCIALQLCNLCFLLATDVTLGMVGVFLWGAQRGTSQLLFAAIISDLVPRKILGTAIGFYQILSGIAYFAASSFSGCLGDKNLAYSFYYGLGVSSLALIVLISLDFYFRKQQVKYA